jgi:hypothetical protein
MANFPALIQLINNLDIWAMQVKAYPLVTYEDDESTRAVKRGPRLHEISKTRNFGVRAAIAELGAAGLVDQRRTRNLRLKLDSLLFNLEQIPIPPTLRPLTTTEVRHAIDMSDRLARMRRQLVFYVEEAHEKNDERTPKPPKKAISDDGGKSGGKSEAVGKVTRRGRMPKAESEARRAAMQAKLTKYPAMKDDIPALASEAGVSERQARRWVNNWENRELERASEQRKKEG